MEPEVTVMAETLRSLLEDPVRRQAMSAAAARLVQERFTWDAVAEGLEKAYQKMESNLTPLAGASDPLLRRG